MVGLGDGETQYTDPQWICIVALIVPLELLLGWFIRKKETEKPEQQIFSMSIETIIDIIFWIWYKHKFTKMAEDYLCVANITGWYVINLILLFVVLIILLCVMMGIIGLEQPFDEIMPMVKAGSVSEMYHKKTEQPFQKADEMVVPNEQSSNDTDKNSESINSMDTENIEIESDGFCTKCGAKLLKNSRFCMQCGEERR
jgi:hypothetical protein